MPASACPPAPCCSERALQGWHTTAQQQQAGPPAWSKPQRLPLGCESPCSAAHSAGWLAAGEDDEDEEEMDPDMEGELMAEFGMGPWEFGGAPG